MKACYCFIEVTVSTDLTVFVKYDVGMALVLLVIATLIGGSMQACDPKNCTLPDCRCYNDPKPPGELEVSEAFVPRTRREGVWRLGALVDGGGVDIEFIPLT